MRHEAAFALSQEYEFEIIEDASHALGGLYYDEYIGCCHYSTVTVFSFHPVKIITTGKVASQSRTTISNKDEVVRSRNYSQIQK